jgi:hypothetical protein
MTTDFIPGAPRRRMPSGAEEAAPRREAIAWLVVSVAGIAIGVIAGVQHRVTPSAILSITVVIGVATSIVARILPRAGDPV